MALGASTYCCGPSSSGDASGSDWSNQKQLPDTTAFVRGDTYYVRGGSYGAKTLIEPESSTTTVTIKKATASDHVTDTGWSAAYGTDQAVFNSFDITTGYWVIDGNASVGTYGIKVYSTDLIKIKIGSASAWPNNITVKSVLIDGSNTSGEGYFGIRIYEYGASSGHWLYNIRIYRMADDPMYLLKISSTTIEYCFFDERGDSAGAHADAMAISSSGNGNIFRYNLVNHDGQQIFFDGTVDNSHGAWDIYGNVFYGGATSGKGIWTHSGNPPVGPVKIYNNTFANLNISLSLGSNGSGVCSNNIFYDITDNTGLATTTHNYNWFKTGMSVQGEVNAQTGSDPFTDYAGADFTLAGATTAGATLASPYNADRVGNTRGDDGTWDRGAYEYQSSATPTVTTDPQSQTNVIGSDITFTIVATGTAPLSYQWRLNGSAISASTATSYTTNSITIDSDQSEYDVVVTNSYGSVTSAVATLTVTNATTFYASPTGNDSENGVTPATAWTLYYALTNAGASNTIILLDGTYTGNFICGAEGQTLQASNKWDAILVANGDIPLSVWPNAISNCVIDGLQITGADADSGIYIDANNTTVRNCWVHHNGTNVAGFHYGIEGHEIRDTTVEKCLVEFNGYTTTDHGIYLAGTNTTVRNNVLRQNAGAGAQVYFYNTDFPNAITTNTWIYNNLIYSNADYGIAIGSIGAPNYYVANNTIVQGSGQACVWLNDSSGGGQNAVLCATNNIFIGSTVIAGEDINFVGQNNYTNATLAGAGFVDTSKGLYWLTSGSGARNQADADIVPAVDFWGNAQASVADCGFAQYSATYAADTRTLDPSPAGGADYWAALSPPAAANKSRANKAHVNKLKH